MVAGSIALAGAWFLLLLRSMKAMNARGCGHPALELATMFAALRRLGVTRRDAYIELLRESMEANDAFLGAWSVWEPDAAGGSDRAFRHHPGHDGTGRFVPFWHRRHGYPKLDPVTGYDDPADSQWYQEPKRSRRVTSVNPYLYPVGGSRCLIASQVAPILVDDVCLGVTGVDFWVEKIAAEAVRESPRRLQLDEDDPVEEILDRGFIVMGAQNEILHWTQRSYGLLSRYDGRLSKDSERLPEKLTSAMETGADSSHPWLQTVGKRTASRIRPDGRRLQMTRVPLRSRPESLVVVCEKRSSALEALTVREREVHGWLCEGKTNDEIGTILGISPHTVKNHLDRIYTKLGVENRMAASRVQ